VFQRSGQQEGAKRGYNPTRPGRHSHHPLLALLAQAPLVLHAWLRSGNTGTACGVTGFLTEALAVIPGGWKLRTVRADSGFFENALLTFLEGSMRKVRWLAGWKDSGTKPVIYHQWSRWFPHGERFSAASSALVRSQPCMVSATRCSRAAMFRWSAPRIQDGFPRHQGW